MRIPTILAGACLLLVSCQQEEGCTDPTAANYDADAEVNDGSCLYPGCTDPAYTEYDSSANTDDGSCMNLLGCSDSDIVSMDGYNYDVVTIGDQCWFAENLRTTVYANGDLIPSSLADDEWGYTDQGETAVYGEGSSTCDNYSPDIDACDEAQSLAEYGRLYNWYAVDDVRGLCPSGWHVPTHGEWTDLEDYITSQGFAEDENGTPLRSTTGWHYGGNGTDVFGFSALPGGFRSSNGSGNFNVAGYEGFWWSSSPDGGNAWGRFLSATDPVIDRTNVSPRYGFSVRCLRDAE